MNDVTPVKGYVVRDDVLYLVTGDTEDLAFLLARNSPVAVSAAVHERSTRDVHVSAQRMLKHVHRHETQSDVVDGVLLRHLVVDHNQPGAEMATYNQNGLVTRHLTLHAND